MRRGRGGGGGGGGGGGNHRGRGRFNMRRDGPMKFEKDFDFESANAQFNKEEIDREFQSKLKIKGGVKFTPSHLCTTSFMGQRCPKTNLLFLLAMVSNTFVQQLKCV